MKILENLLSDEQRNDSEVSKFHWFLDRSFDLIELNLKTLEKISHQLSTLKDHINKCTCACLLSNSKLFCYGGVDKWPYFIKVSFIIDENYNTKILPPGIPSPGKFAIHHQDFIYIFERFSAARFNLAKWKWEQIPQTPETHDWCNCISFNNFILASACNYKGIFVFDSLIFSFSSTSLMISLHRTKILCKSENLAYLIDFSGKIFQSDINDPFNWSIIGDCKPSILRTHGYKVFYQNCWYFSLGPKLLKFDLDKISIEKISISLPVQIHPIEEQLL